MTPREADIVFALSSFDEIEAMYAVPPLETSVGEAVEVVVQLRETSARTQGRIGAHLASAFGGGTAPFVLFVEPTPMSSPRFMHRAVPLALAQKPPRKHHPCASRRVSRARPRLFAPETSSDRAETPVSPAATRVSARETRVSPPERLVSAWETRASVRETCVSAPETRVSGPERCVSARETRISAGETCFLGAKYGVSAYFPFFPFAAESPCGPAATGAPAAG